jgi:hypothetical protein
MKKVIAIFAIATLVACGNASTEVTSTDSTAVAVDSTLATTDSTVAGTATPTTEFEVVK